MAPSETGHRPGWRRATIIARSLGLLLLVAAVLCFPNAGPIFASSAFRRQGMRRPCPSVVMSSCHRPPTATAVTPSQIERHSHHNRTRRGHLQPRLPPISSRQAQLAGARLNHPPNPRRPNPHSARGTGVPHTRGFLPWRLSDTGPGTSPTVAMGRHPKPFTLREQSAN